MVSYVWYSCSIRSNNAVLILVVVDNGLVQEGELFIWFGMSVLILVVVDNGLVLDLIRLY